MRPLKIALDTQAARQQRTGIGMYAAALLQALMEDGTVAPVAIDWGCDPVMRVPQRIAWQQLRLPARARAAHADLLHVTGFDAPLWRPLPTVLTLHDLIGMLFPQRLPPIARLYWSRWLPFSVRFADAVITDSRWARDDIVRLLGLPAERVTVVPLAADRRFTPQPPAEIARVRHTLGLPAQMLLYVGTLEPRKGVDTLIEAWALLANRWPAARLVIAGKKGWYTNELDALVQRLGLGARVQFTGYIADADLPALYAAAHAFSFPSRYEGFGLPPLEAMACGTPVIVSNASSLPEVVGDAGLLVPPDDVAALAAAIERIFAAPDLRAELAQRGATQAARFSWQRTAQQTIAVYRDVAQRRGIHL